MKNIYKVQNGQNLGYNRIYVQPINPNFTLYTLYNIHSTQYIHSYTVYNAFYYINKSF